jgi:hypothetical protein
MRTTLTAALALSLFGGCAPEIGDDCETSVDCSVNGDRICDRAQPGGYCTVMSCEENTCPEDAVCVEFRFMPARLAESYCMAPCDDDGDCRDGYDCVRVSELDVIARVLDDGGDDGLRFCSPAP